MPIQIKLAAVLCFLTMALSACSGSFTPSTMEAARCKKDCSTALLNCKQSQTICEAGFASCMDYCADVDRIKQKQP